MSRRAVLSLLALGLSSLHAGHALAAESSVAGERAFQYCYSCHSLDPSEAGLQGPALNGIVGAAIASRAFDYSPALRAFAAEHGVWTEPLLERFIADPEALVPGTAMMFHGVRDPDERTVLIAYLKAAGP